MPQNTTFPHEHTFRTLYSILVPACLVLAACSGGGPAQQPPPSPAPTTFSNPLTIQIPSGGTVQDCPDPSVIRGQQPGDTLWYMYCTTDPLNDTDKNASGSFNFHLISMHKSSDLVHWNYVGDVFKTRPAWVGSTAGLWASAIKFFNNMYYLYFAASMSISTTTLATVSNQLSTP